MPRIRTVKPEALQHRKVGRLSDRAFRLWVTMLTQADDDGRLVADPGQLRLLTWGYHEQVTEKDVAAALGEIAGWGLVLHYTVADVPYAAFPSWRDHQRINRPTPSKLPSPADYVKAHGPLTEPSVTIHAGSERIKDQGSREGGEFEGREDPQPRSLSLVSSIEPEPPGNGSGTPLRRPALSEYQETLERIRAKNPHLTEAQAQDEELGGPSLSDE